MEFPTSDVEIRQILTEGEAFDDALIFLVLCFGVRARVFINPVPALKPPADVRCSVAARVNQLV